jgi:hypothetical protein
LSLDIKKTIILRDTQSLVPRSFTRGAQLNLSPWCLGTVANWQPKVVMLAYRVMK